MSKLLNTPEIWVIRHKETGEVFTAPSGKTSWKKPAHAKNAWGTLKARYYSSKEDVEKKTKLLGVYPFAEKRWDNTIRWEFPKFDQQDTWELERLVTKAENRIGEAERLLKLCLGRVDYNIEIMIEDYFKQGELNE